MEELKSVFEFGEANGSRTPSRDVAASLHEGAELVLCTVAVRGAADKVEVDVDEAVLRSP